ncbi:MAG TPA: ABC transporter substrate-binding protein [Solirubrobacter sp.]|nr:ABC transporter substrate-binding protein [Solirubrobacter sp.]
MILGTTDKVVSLDPAGAYDLGSQQLIGNMYQNLLSVPAGGNKPEPDAAESCDFTDPKTYVCKLKPDLKFSSGDPLTSEDVKFSLDRQLKIADPSGPSSLLASMKSVDATDPQTVTMHLKKADGTWPFILTHTVAAIVPSKIYPADAKQPDDKAVGSGPYKLDKYTPNQQAVFSLNPNYTGANKGQTPNFIVQYFEQPSALKLAIEQGDVDVAYRSLSPTDLEALKNESDKGVKVVDGAGTEIRYIVFNVKKKPVDQLAVRQAIAQVIDRQAIATNVYKDTVTPLYSTVPAALPGATQPFKDVFGDPDPEKAKKFLEDAGISTPVELDGWYTPTHYGPVEVDLWNELKRQLEASGLFKVNIDSTEWDQYKDEAFAKHTYYFYGLGWFPDFPDGDNYLSPFMRDGGFFQNGYTSKRVNDALDKELESSDENDRTEAFKVVQQAEADDVPLIPLWEGKQIAAVRDGVEGVENTFDPAFQFRFWLVTKKES